MVKVFVDCLVEVFVEYFYECVCKVYWGYVLNENFSNEELICENYQGICLVLGYLVCLEYMEKVIIWELLEVEKYIGMKFIEFFVMWFGVLVLGWYFSYLDSKYYVVV